MFNRIETVIATDQDDPLAWISIRIRSGFDPDKTWNNKTIILTISDPLHRYHNVNIHSHRYNGIIVGQLLFIIWHINQLMGMVYYQ